MTVRVELHFEGFNQLRNSPEILAELDRQAEKLAEKAGPGFAVESAKPHKARGRAHVFTETEQAKRAEAVDAALTRAVGG
jgi:hypothetical protein